MQDLLPKKYVLYNIADNHDNLKEFNHFLWENWRGLILPYKH